MQAPALTPQPVVDAIGGRIRDLLNDPELKDWTISRGLVNEIITGAKAKASQDSLYKLIQENDEIFKKYGG